MYTMKSEVSCERVNKLEDFGAGVARGSDAEHNGVVGLPEGGDGGLGGRVGGECNVLLSVSTAFATGQGPATIWEGHKMDCVV